MRTVKNQVLGDIITVDKYSSKWLTVKLHPTTFYRRHTTFMAHLDTTTGPYALLDYGDSVLLRFMVKSDYTNFYKAHHEYI